MRNGLEHHAGSISAELKALRRAPQQWKPGVKSKHHVRNDALSARSTAITVHRAGAAALLARILGAVVAGFVRAIIAVVVEQIFDRLVDVVCRGRRFTESHDESGRVVDVVRGGE